MLPDLLQGAVNWETCTAAIAVAQNSVVAGSHTPTVEVQISNTLVTLISLPKPQQQCLVLMDH